jgi:hypothetical protein
VSHPASPLSTVVSRAGAGAAVWVLLVAVVAVPLVLVGAWLPFVAAVVLVVCGVVAVLVARRVPAVRVPTPAAALLVLVCVGAGVWAGLTHGEHVVLRRDAGTYALYGQHLAQAHQGDVDVAVGAVGGPSALGLPGVTVGSPGFYEQGTGASTHVLPQFLAATPVWLSFGWWLGGWTGLLLVPAVALAAALLAFAGLAVRLVGPWWALLATATLAVAQPVLHVGRATYSEPLALLVGCAGAAVLVAAARHASSGLRADAGRLALLAGLLLGGVALVRVDALRETALLLPGAALLAVRREGVGGRLVVGLAVSTAVSAASAALTTRPYLASIKGSLVPLAAGVVALAVVSACLVLVARRGVRLGGVLRRRLPWVLSGLVVLAGVVLASRPLWQTVRQSAADPGSRVVAGLQLAQHLPVDGGRTYAEHSVLWVSWWVGVPALLLALLGAAGLAWRLGAAWRDDEPLPAWTALTLAAVGSVVLTLYRPGITPDHPWADRRLVPVVLPAVVLLATAGGAGLVRAVSRRWSRDLGVGLAAVVVVAVLLPTALATAPVAAQRTERGEVAALDAACRAFAPGDTAILVDGRAANEWTQALRGACSVPTVAVHASPGHPADVATVVAVARDVVAAGRRPVVVSAESPEALTRLGAVPAHAVHLVTTEDQRLLTRRPEGSARLTVDLWVASAT